MHLLVLIVNKVNKLEDLIVAFSKVGIKGATILDSYGMAKVLSNHKEDLPLFGSLRMLLNEKRPFNKTIITVIKDEQVEPALSCIREVIGDLSKPNVGIVFTIPINYVEGLRE